jgi:flagellum-specific peptidoglycan hydrolase FlgJ
MRNSQSHARSVYQESEQPQDQTLWKLLLISALAYIIWNDVKVTDTLAEGIVGAQPSTRAVREKASFAFFAEKRKPTYGVELPKSAKSPLAFAMDPGFAERYDIPEQEVAQYTAQLRAYVEQYAPIAVAEARAFGIPASITLAQGLLESGVGRSRLAVNSRNHFGIKCFSRTCHKGHCVNATDDTHKDFFVKYRSVWESYRAHSKLLKSNARYKPLFQLDSDDFQGWAQGLSKQGYATDPKYAQKLMAIISTLGLEKYDGA